MLMMAGAQISTRRGFASDHVHSCFNQLSGPFTELNAMCALIGVTSMSRSIGSTATRRIWI